MKAGGEAYLSNAVLNDQFLLRACIVNFRTTLEDVEAIPEIVARHGRVIHEGLRRAHLQGSERATS